MVGVVAAVGAFAAWKRGPGHPCTGSLPSHKSYVSVLDAARPMHEAASDAEIEAAFSRARTSMVFGIAAAVAPAVGVIFGLGLLTWLFHAFDGDLSTFDRTRAWSDAMAGWLDPDAALQTSLALIAAIVTVNVAVSLAASSKESVRGAAATSVWSTAQTALAVSASSCVLLLATVATLGLVGTHDRAVGKVVLLIALAFFAIAFAATIAVSNDSGVDRRRSAIERRRRAEMYTRLREALIDRRPTPAVPVTIVKGLFAVLIVVVPIASSTWAIAVSGGGGSIWLAIGVAASWAGFVFLAVWYGTAMVWTTYSRRGEPFLTRVSIGLLVAWHLIAVGCVAYTYVSAEEEPVVAAGATAVMLMLPGIYAALVFIDYRRRTRRWRHAWRYVLFPVAVIWETVIRGLNRRISGLVEFPCAEASSTKTV